VETNSNLGKAMTYLLLDWEARILFVRQSKAVIRDQQPDHPGRRQDGGDSQGKVMPSLIVRRMEQMLAREATGDRAE
jgi:hypothetical protein